MSIESPVTLQQPINENPVEVAPITISDPSIQITAFPDNSAQCKEEITFTWSQIVGRMRDPIEYPSKEACSLLKLCHFGDLRTDKNCLRHNANVLSVGGIECDYDAEVISVEEAVATLSQARLKSLIYTSPSHTPEAPRWRLLAPFSGYYAASMQEMNDHRKQMVGRMNKLFGGALAIESFTMSQGFYFGKVVGSQYQAEVIDGDFIDQRDDLAVEMGVSSGGGGGSAGGFMDDFNMEKCIKGIHTGENYHQSTNRIAAHLVALGKSRDDVIDELETIYNGGVATEKWADRYAGIEHAVDTAIEKFEPPPELTVLEMFGEPGVVDPEREKRLAEEKQAKEQQGIIEYTAAMAIEAITKDCEKTKGLDPTAEGRQKEKGILKKAAKIVAENSGVSFKSQLGALYLELKRNTKTGVTDNKATFENELKSAKQEFRKQHGSAQTAMVPSSLTIAVPTLPVLVQQGGYENIFWDLKANAAGELFPLGTARNWARLLEDTGIALHYNEMSREIEIWADGGYGFSTDDIDQCYEFILDGGVRNGLPVTRAKDLLNALSGQRRYHPFITMMHDVTWDGVDRLKQAADCVPVVNKENWVLMLKRWLISAYVAVHGYPPNRPPRGVLILTGAQYARKSTYLHSLFPHTEMFKEGMHLALGASNEKDYIELATTAMAVELGEFDHSLSRSHAGSLKAFLGLSQDEYRAAYARTRKKHPRRTVFCGTVNDDEFLTDHTGNTRYWVTKVTGQIDTDTTESMDRVQLWAQIKHLHLVENEPYLMSPNEVDRLESVNKKEFTVRTHIDELLEEAFEWGDENYNKYKESDIREWTPEQRGSVINFMTSGEIAKLLGVEIKTRMQQIQLSQGLKRITGMDSPPSDRHNALNKKYRAWRLPPKVSGYHGGKMLF